MSELGWGLQITALGMGLVFGLLALMWVLLELAGRFDTRGAAPPAADPAADEAAPLSAVTVSPGPGAETAPAPELVAAMLVATLAHRAHLRREAAPSMRSYWPGSLLYASRWVGAGRMRQNRNWVRRSR